MTKKPTPVTTPTAGPQSIDVKTVANLAKVVGEFDLSEIEVEIQGLKIRVARERYPSSGAHVVAAPAPTYAPAAAPAPAVVAPAAPSAADHPGVVKSPMVGTAYLRPRPESKAFVEVGSVVKSGDKIMLVEAMKTYNEIVAPRAGKITHIFVEDGSPVEYGQALMVVE